MRVEVGRGKQVKRLIRALEAGFEEENGGYSLRRGEMGDVLSAVDWFAGWGYGCVGLRGGGMGFGEGFLGGTSRGGRGKGGGYDCAVGEEGRGREGMERDCESCWRGESREGHWRLYASGLAIVVEIWWNKLL